MREKHLQSILGALALVLLAGCSSAPRLVCWPVTAAPLKARAVCEVKP